MSDTNIICFAITLLEICCWANGRHLDHTASSHDGKTTQNFNISKADSKFISILKMNVTRNSNVSDTFRFQENVSKDEMYQALTFIAVICAILGILLLGSAVGFFIQQLWQQGGDSNAPKAGIEWESVDMTEDEFYHYLLALESQRIPSNTSSQEWLLLENRLQRQYRSSTD